MTRLFSKLAGAFLALGLALAAGPAHPDETLTILSVNDTHSNLDASGPKDANLDGTIGGLVKASGVITRLRATEPNTVFLHAGDLFQGDSYFNATLGIPEMRLLGMLELDAMVLGNHELWFPAETFAYAWNAAGQPFPVISANVVAGPLAFVQPSTMLQVGDLKVGVVGLTTPLDLPSQANATFLGAFMPPAPPTELLGIAGAQVAALRAQGANVVILLSHLGIGLDRAIAGYLPGLDAIVGGHDHYEIAETVTGPGGKLVPIVHAGAYYRDVGKVQLSVGPSGVSVVSVDLVPVDQRVPRPTPAESPIAAAVAQVQLLVAATFPQRWSPPDPFHTAVAYAEDDVSNQLNMKVPKRDTGTGNLVADAFRARTGTDLAFTVTGQTPQGLAAGPVVQEDLFRMVGIGFDPATRFGARIATAHVYGWALAKAIETTIAYSLLDDDYILQVSGMKYVYDSSRPPGQRIVSIEIGGAPLDPLHEYSATMNALLLQTMPSLGIPFVPGTAHVLDDFEFLAIRDYVAGLGSFSYSGENRVRDLAVRGDARND